MSVKIMQVNFRFNGPWGNDQSKDLEGLAQILKDTDGMVWKIWAEDAVNKEVAGYYLFTDQASVEAYLDVHIPRLQSLADSHGVRNIHYKIFDVNVPLTEITHGKLY